MQRIKNIIVFCLVLMLFANCKRQNNNFDKGLSAYKKAEKNLNDYYRTKDDSLLYLGLKNAEESLQCSQTRYQAISLKIALLSQLKNYTRGYEFVDSLSESDFKLKYKKEMWHCYFHALESESIGDTTQRNIYLIKIISGIQNYIREVNMPDEKEYEEAYHDIFFSKTNILNNQILDTISN